MHAYTHMYTYIIGCLATVCLSWLVVKSIQCDELIIHFRLEDEEHLFPYQHMVKCL